MTGYLGAIDIQQFLENYFSNSGITYTFAPTLFI
jgi:hypothetical protein